MSLDQQTLAGMFMLALWHEEEPLPPEEFMKARALGVTSLRGCQSVALACVAPTTLHMRLTPARRGHDRKVARIAA